VVEYFVNFLRFIARPDTFMADWHTRLWSIFPALPGDSVAAPAFVSTK
jgi:hypothetical protein